MLMYRIGIPSPVIIVKRNRYDQEIETKFQFLQEKFSNLGIFCFEKKKVEKEITIGICS